MSTEDRRNVVALQAYLETQGMSLEEEVQEEKAINQALADIVDERIVDPDNDETREAITKNEAYWRDMVDSIDIKKDFEDMTWEEVVFIARKSVKLVRNIDADMSESKYLRDKAEEAVR